MLFKKNYLIYLAYSILINLRQGQLKIVQKWQFENVQLWQFKMAIYG